MSETQVERLLVYGLLRRSMSMESLMERVAEFMGERRVPGFSMYDLGNYPGAVAGDGELIAELYAIDPAAFQALDEAEGVFDDPPLYRRVQVELHDGPAWIYEYTRPVEHAARIPSGDWTKRS